MDHSTVTGLMPRLSDSGRMRNVNRCGFSCRQRGLDVWWSRSRWGWDGQSDIALAARRAGRVGRGCVGSDGVTHRRRAGQGRGPGAGHDRRRQGCCPGRVWRLAGRDAPTTTPKCSVQVIREITGLLLTAGRGRRTAPKATVWSHSRIASRRRRHRRSQSTLE
jgi:hypothetical protein